MRRQQTSTGRYYPWVTEGTTERYWSVTTILKALPKDALKFWAAKTVAEFAYDHASNWLGMDRARAVDYLKREPLRFTSSRADVGTAVHGIAEAIALGKPAPDFDSLEERQHVAAYLDFVRMLAPTYVATEAAVYSRTHKYAGTLDAITEVGIGALEDLEVVLPAAWRDAAERNDGTVRLLLDYKTSAGVYPDVALQLNAYAHADFIGLADGSEKPLPPIDGLAVLHLKPNRWWLYPVMLDPSIFKTFLYVREVFRWMEVISKQVLGDPMGRDLEVEERAR